MSISKVKQIRLETTAEYQPISDLNVRFFNQDINTSVLDFIVTRNNDPIPLGVDNIEATIVLTSNKFKISDEVKIKDGLNGILTYTLPDDILERPGKVTGQIYIGIKGKEDTVVQRLFSFNIEDSLINSFDAETKLVYIRKFDQLEEQISQRVESIEQAIANSEDYVTKVINEKETALKQIDNEKSKIFKKIDDEKENINSLKSQYINEIDEKGTEINQSIDKFKGDFDLESYITETKSKNWQKYKLTNDNGTVKFLNMNGNLEDYRNLPPGEYYTANTPADTIAVSTAGFTTVEQRDSSIKRITYRPYNSSQVWQMRYYQSWFDWERVNFTQSDTGWIPFQLINGALSNTAYKGEDDGGFDCAYRTITNGSEVTKKIRVNGTNLTPNQVIAQLPSNFAKNAQAFPVRVTNSSAGGYVVIRPSGRVNFYVSGDTSNWNESAYAYGEMSWYD